MEKLYYSIYNAKTKYELVCNSTYSSDLLCILTDLTKFLLKFCVDEVFEDRGAINMRRIKRDKISSLGIPKAPQVNISMILKHLSFRMPRLASHLSSSTIIGIPWFLFRSHDFCQFFCSSFMNHASMR